MKRLAHILTLMLFVLGACSKMNNSTATREVFCSVRLGDGTRASFDADGKAGHVNRCKMQILHNGKMISEDIVKTKVKNGVVTADFNKITLSRGERYTYLFWADRVADASTPEGLATDNFYNTADLRNVLLDTVGYAGNDDSRDAFCKCVDNVEIDAFPDTVVLRRPFAQLNVIASDVLDFRKQAGDSLFKQMFPTQFGISFSAPTRYDVESGKASEPRTFTSDKRPAYGVFVDTLGLQTLTMDYILAPADESALTEIVWSASKPVDSINCKFTNIPLRRNYRTNIIGGILTNTGEFKVTIKPGWYEPEYNY